MLINHLLPSVEYLVDKVNKTAQECRKVAYGWPDVGIVQQMLYLTSNYNPAVITVFLVLN